MTDQNLSAMSANGAADEAAMRDCSDSRLCLRRVSGSASWGDCGLHS